MLSYSFLNKKKLTKLFGHMVFIWIRKAINCEKCDPHFTILKRKIMLIQSITMIMIKTHEYSNTVITIFLKIKRKHTYMLEIFPWWCSHWKMTKAPKTSIYEIAKKEGEGWGSISISILWVGPRESSISFQTLPQKWWTFRLYAHCRRK